MEGQAKERTRTPKDVFELDAVFEKRRNTR
jgi:hypothetical protein